MTLGDAMIAMRVLLVGGDVALLEGLSQAFAAQGYATRVAASLSEAREMAARQSPLLVIVEADLALEAANDVLSIQPVPGGAVILYHTRPDDRARLIPALQRSVLAELTLPLERNRLLALAQHVSDRAIATGRSGRRTPPEQRAL
jgi:DNA-binding NtrC family response regulator